MALRQETVSISADSLKLVSPEEALRIFNEEMGVGDVWESPLMGYRTTSRSQRDWRIEVGNWIACAKRHDFWSDVQKVIAPRRSDKGVREAGDSVHRNVGHRLAEIMAVYYLTGIGWTFYKWSPDEFRPRNDVDFQLFSPSGSMVNFQVKSSGRLGLHDNEVDVHIQEGIRKAACQLPQEQQSIVVVIPQRSWWITSDVDVIDSFVGTTCSYPNGSVVLHSDEHGELESWNHVSALAAIDLRRGAAPDYCCSVVLNPWASQPVDSSWFPYSRVLACSEKKFEWVRGEPASTSVPSGTSLSSRPRKSTKT